MKATEQYFPVALFIMLYKLVLTLGLWMKSSTVTIKIIVTEQFTPLVFCFFMLIKLVQNVKVCGSNSVMRAPGGGGGAY